MERLILFLFQDQAHAICVLPISLLGQTDDTNALLLLTRSPCFSSEFSFPNRAKKSPYAQPCFLSSIPVVISCSACMFVISMNCSINSASIADGYLIGLGASRSVHNGGKKLAKSVFHSALRLLPDHTFRLYLVVRAVASTSFLMLLVDK